MLKIIGAATQTEKIILNNNLQEKATYTTIARILNILSIRMYLSKGPDSIFEQVYGSVEGLVNTVYLPRKNTSGTGGVAY